MHEEKKYEILGIGNPLMDQLIPVKESFLAQVPGTKGGMLPVDYHTLVRIMKNSGAKPTTVAGGSCANAIKGLANLGISCGLSGKLGSDIFASNYLKGLANLRITSCCLSSPTPTGQVLCLITPDGQRTCRAYLGASHEFTGDELDPEIFEGVSLVHIEGYSLLNHRLTLRAMELAKAAKAKVSFDLASFEITRAFSKSLPKLLARYVDILFANQDEVKELIRGDPFKGCSYLKDITDISVVFLGKDGCCIGHGNRVFHSPALSVPVVDTTGAGDLFASGFLYGYRNKRPIEQCAAYGNLVASEVIQVVGAEIPKERWKFIKEQLGEKQHSQ